MLAVLSALALVVWAAVGAANSNLAGHDLPSEPSMSGSPMWFMKDTRRLAAIHAGTVAGGTIRKAIVMNDTVRAPIRRWLQQTLPPKP